MTNIESSNKQHHPMPRRSRWPYWVFVPICALAYTAYCFGFMLEAWGRRGESKPWWFELAFALTIPGFFAPPLGAPFFGGALGFGFIRLVRWIRERHLK